MCLGVPFHVCMCVCDYRYVLHGSRQSWWWSLSRSSRRSSRSRRSGGGGGGGRSTWHGGEPCWGHSILICECTVWTPKKINTCGDQPWTKVAATPLVTLVPPYSTLGQTLLGFMCSVCSCEMGGNVQQTPAPRNYSITLPGQSTRRKSTPLFMKRRTGEDETILHLRRRLNSQIQSEQTEGSGPWPVINIWHMVHWEEHYKEQWTKKFPGKK